VVAAIVIIAIQRSRFDVDSKVESSPTTRAEIPRITPEAATTVAPT
jgi:hypothetical protein